MDPKDPFPQQSLLYQSPAQIASHFQHVAQRASSDKLVESLTADLLSRVHSGALPPSIFSIWLNIVRNRSLHVLNDALLDGRSRCVRRDAIRTLGRALKGKQWKNYGWNAVGGAQGLIEIFDTVSVWEAHQLASVIGGCNGNNDLEKADLIGDLAVRLLPGLVPSTTSVSTNQSRMERPLSGELIDILRGCSPDFLAPVLSEPLPTSFPMWKFFRRLSETRSGLLRDISLKRVPASLDVRRQVLRNCLPILVSSVEPYETKSMPPGFVSRSVPGVGFYYDLIESIESDLGTHKDDIRGPIFAEAKQVIKLAVRRKVPFNEILAILERLISLQERIGWKRSFAHFVPRKLMWYWAFAASPETYREASMVPAARKRLSAHPSNPKTEHRVVLEGLLVRLIKILPSVDNLSSRSSNMLYTNFCDCVTTIPVNVRLPFLKLWLSHLPGINVNLNEPRPSEKEQKYVVWDVDVLSVLPPQDARWLCERAGFTSISYSRAVKPWLGAAGEDLAWYGEELLKVKWEAEEGDLNDGHPAAKALLDDLKQKAERDRDETQRLLWAQRAVDTAVLSMSVDLLEEVASWLRRFIRDPMVGPELAKYVHSSDTAPVLSCVELPRARQPVDLPDLAALVEKANSVFAIHIQAAVLAAREPSFQSHDYNHIDSLLSEVVTIRMKGVEKLHRKRIGPKQEIVQILLYSMIPILLEYERTSLDEWYRNRLRWDNLSGPLNRIPPPDRPKSYFIRFLDDLAMKRDELVIQERIKDEPSVVELGNGWPRGLAVQHLMPINHFGSGDPWAKSAMEASEAAPFVTSRVRQVVFCDPKTARQEVPYKAYPIGKFVDSLPFAMGCYINGGPSHSKGERILEIWDHYSRVLTSDIGHIESLKAKLASIARDSGLQWVSLSIDPPLLPSLPEISDEVGAVEWDPRPNSNSKRSTKTTARDAASWGTLLLCRFRNEFTYQECFRDEFENPEPWDDISKENVLAIWEPSVNISKLPLQNQDALIVSTVLYLDSLTTGSARILSQKFPPGTQETRYPSVFLDYDFTSAIGKDTFSPRTALRALEQLVDAVPPRLLQDLAQSLLKTFIELPQDSAKYADIQYITFAVIRLLQVSDRPQLAVDLGLQVVQGMPDASSWHRQLITLGLGRQLLREDAMAMFENFAGFIFGALEKQQLQNETEAAKQKQGHHVSNTPSKAFVKISTVKMLGQLLAENNFIPFHVSISILGQLFNASRHIDVRNVVVAAVLQLLRKPDADDAEIQEAYTTFKSFSVAATGPSERDDISEEEWLEAENGGPLPKVSDDRPLFTLFTQTSKASLPVRFHETYFQDVVLPVLAESTRQHSRWMRALLNRINIDTEEDFGPFDKDAVGKIFAVWTAYMPKSFLHQQHRNWAMRYLDLYLKRDRYKDVDKKIAVVMGQSWRKTDEGKHWNSYFRSQDQNNAFSRLHFLLSNGVRSKVPNGMTNEDVMDEYITRVRIVLRHPLEFKAGDEKPRVSLNAFNAATAPLRPPKIHSAIFNKRMFPLLKRVREDVSSLRTEDWLKYPNRDPVILPSLMRLDTFHLPYPHLDHADPQSTKKYDDFVNVMVGLINRCAGSANCMAEFKYLEEAMDLIADKDVGKMAIWLGRGCQNEHENVTGVLRVELARRLLGKMKAKTGKKAEKDEMVEDEAREMVEEWKESRNEWIRSIGWMEE